MKLAAFAVLLAGCSAPRAPAPAPRTAAGPPAAVAPAPAAPAPAAPSGDVLLATTADLDGRPGDERVELHADGTLRAGALSFRVDLGERHEYFWPREASLRAVDLDTASGRLAILLTTPIAEDEDPPSRFQLFLVAGGRLVRVFDQVIGVYNSPALVFPGDGTLHYLEQGWMACERARHPPGPVARQEVVYRLDRAGTRMLEWQRRDAGDRQDCSQLAACPFVYALSEAGATRVGEILRDLRGARAYSLQSIPLPAGTTRVRIAEEKPEVTYLDEVILEVGGVEHRPLACRGAPAPAYCAADRVPLVLHRGDALDLAFDTGDTGGEVRLFARGYYVPD